MKNDNTKKTIYYESYSDDFVESREQNFKLPNDYKWINNSLLYRTGSELMYMLVRFFSYLYCRFVLHIKFCNLDVIREHNDIGFFLYGNHTQAVGDPFIPVRASGSKRCYVLASPANLGVPFLGRLLPMFGALPVPDTISGVKKLHNAIDQRIGEKSGIVIYPEEHVWPWYTGIRPYSPTAFGFPVEHSVPVFSMTTTYQKRKSRNKPKITVYIDGPFYSDSALTKKEQKENLHNQVYEAMKKRSKNSTYEYMIYKKGELHNEYSVLRK